MNQTTDGVLGVVPLRSLEGGKRRGYCALLPRSYDGWKMTASSPSAVSRNQFFVVLATGTMM